MNEKNTNSRNSLIIIVLAVLFCAYFLFGSGDNGSGAGEIRNELNAAGRNQQSIADGIADAQNTAGKLESGITNAEQSAIRIESNQQTAGELIADCQRIVREVRARAERETTKP